MSNPATVVSGAWLAALDSKGAVQLMCISSFGPSGHMQCVLRGKGPVVPEISTGNLSITGIFMLGRFEPTGGSKPVAIECMFVFQLIESATNLMMSASSVVTSKAHAGGSVSFSRLRSSVKRLSDTGIYWPFFKPKKLMMSIKFKLELTVI